MQESQNINRTEELLNKTAEAKSKAFEEEIVLIDKEVRQRAKDLLKKLQAKEEQIFYEKIEKARTERKLEEETLKQIEVEYHRKFEEERRKKVEEHRRQIEKAKRKAEEERRRQEEVTRQKAEEEERLRAAEEARKKAEEERRKLEDELRRHEEESRRKEEEERVRREQEQRRDEDRRRQEEEHQERIRFLIANAETFFNSGDNENALIEIAKALVNDPANSQARELETKIRELREDKTTPPPEEEKPKQKKPPSTKGIEPLIAVKKKRSKTPLVAAIIISLLVITLIFFPIIKQHVFTTSVTIAILPFSSASNISEESIIGSSLAEEVSSKFEYLPSARVLCFSSAYNLSKYNNNPVQEIFRLGYTYALQGTFAQSDQKASVKLTLIDSSGQIAWSQKYEKSITAISNIPGEIAQDLLNVLKIPPTELPSTFKTYKTSPNHEAYLLYLRAIELLHHPTEENLSNARALLDQTVMLDPKFTEGLACDAFTLASQIEIGWRKGDTAILKGKQLAEAATSANNSLHLGFVALGKLLAQSKEYKKALEKLDHAQELAPNNSQTYLEKAKIHIKVGKFKDAIDELEQAYKLNSCEPEILRTFALAHQLSGSAKQGIRYYDAALLFIDDPQAYLAGPMADIITFDPDLRLNRSERVISACEGNLIKFPKDYKSLYHLARLKQVLGNPGSDSLLHSLERLLTEEIRLHPKDAHIMMSLTLTLTRLGKYSDAINLAEKANQSDPGNAEIKYKTAQMYSLQVYSQKTKALDPKIKEAVLRYLKQAISINYRIDEIANADFYNIYDQSEFRSIIKEPLQ